MKFRKVTGPSSKILVPVTGINFPWNGGEGVIRICTEHLKILSCQCKCGGPMFTSGIKESQDKNLATALQDSNFVQTNAVDVSVLK
jgi:hypothetical protein